MRYAIALLLAVSVSLPARADRASELTAVLSRLEGSWSSASIDASGATLTDMFRIERTAGGWSYAGGSCTKDAAGAGRCGSYISGFSILGSELRDARGRLLNVKGLSADVLEYELVTAGGTVFAYRWELAPNGKLTKTVIRTEPNEAPQPPETAVYERQR